jgi:hypothetical protein
MIRQALTFILLTLAVPVSLLARETKEIAPYYTIRQRVKDAAIPADQSLARFRVHGETLPKSPVLHWSADNKPYQQPLKERTFDIALPKGKHVFQFFIDGHLEIYTDSIEFGDGERVEIDLFFLAAEGRVIAEKPVIYLYPEQTQNVNIRLQPAGDFLFTYPAYENGWDVSANSDGTIVHNEKTYPYLFWEAEMTFAPETSDDPGGFIVEKDRIVSFLEEKLTAMGLNATEQTDFITYWGPQLGGSQRVFLRFAWNEQANRFAQLQITPQPDHVNRLYLIWSPLDAASPISTDLQAQQLPVFDRAGFDVLEWGGMRIPYELIYTTFFADK